MQINIQSFSVFLAITHIIQIVVFFFQYKINKNIRGISWFFLWSVTEIIAFALIFVRKIPFFEHFSILFLNIFMLLGTIFIYIGLLRFFDKKINFKFLIGFYLCFLITHLYFIYLENNIVLRSININFYLTAIALLSAGIIQKHKTSPISLTANFLIFIIITHGFVFGYRTIMIMLGTSVTDVFTPTIFNVLPYIDAAIVSLLWTFGCIMMVNQRLNLEITEANSQFKTIFETSPDSAVISTLDKGIFIECNENFNKLTGYSKNEVIGHSALDIKLWQNPDDRFEIVKIVKENGICENFESNFIQKNGTTITGLLAAKIIQYKGIPHLISVTRDITDRKVIEQEIKNKNEALRNLNAEKDRFFSIIAHDLRSPFNGFLGLTELMVNESNNLSAEEIEHFSKLMRESALNLFRLLENLLEWSRMEQGLIPYNRLKLQLILLINESLTNIVDAASVKEIEIKIKISPDFEVFADKNILQSVIRNLVSNAVKFTPKGGFIEILADRNPDFTLISIKDTGIGMNQSIIENLFTLNNQSNRTGTNEEPSTGLGLILCKTFIEKHGGKIDVESQEGKGSVFKIALPNDGKQL